jgi:glucokinase
MFAPHLPWLDAPVRERLEKRWGVPVVLENDATAAAHAEATYGAARGADHAVIVTLGTGIGGGIVLGGRLHRGHNGMAGEFGHMQVAPGGLSCQCGGRGCWEQYSSGNALVRYAREALGSRPTMLEEMCSGNPELLTGLLVTEAAAAGDLLAHEAFAHVGDWLGVGLANLVAAFDPDCLVVGGGVSGAGDRLLEPARTALLRTLVGAGHRDVPPLLPAALGPEAGLVGAADLARQLRG